MSDGLEQTRCLQVYYLTRKTRRAPSISVATDFASTPLANTASRIPCLPYRSRSWIIGSGLGRMPRIGHAKSYIPGKGPSPVHADGHVPSQWEGLGAGSPEGQGSCGVSFAGTGESCREYVYGRKLGRAG